jgi:hypothetical protein
VIDTHQDVPSDKRSKKRNSDERVTVDKEVYNNDDIQRYEEDRSYKQQSTTANNCIF